MKRELAFALDCRSQILDSVGKTRSNRVPTTKTRERKRVKKHAEPLVEPAVVQHKETDIGSSKHAVVQHTKTEIAACTEACADLEDQVAFGFLNDVVNVPMELENNGCEPCDATSEDLGDQARLGFMTNVPIELEKPGVNLAVTVPVEVRESSLFEFENVREASELRVAEVNNGVRESSNAETTCSHDASVAKKNKKANNLSRAITPRRFTRSALKLIEKEETSEATYPVESSAIDWSGNDAGLFQGQNPGGGLSNKRRKKMQGQKLNTPRRFTRSALKLPEDKENYEVAISMESSEAGVVDVGQNAEGTLSKQISLSKIPTTVKELFETGLLEGYQVSYKGGKKGTELQGTITGLGILCSCGLCQGCRVITPSQFEIHACNSYRRAAQYIYLNGGISLIQLLQACRDAKLNTLEATIQNAIGLLQKRNLNAPQNCKDTTSRTTSGNAESISMKPVGFKYASFKPSRSVEVPKSSESAKASSTLTIKNFKRKSSLQKSSAGSLPKYLGKNTCGKITMKDQGLHKLVFAEGGLPDRTALGYFVRGKRLLEGHKQGSGIFCNCCDSVISASQFEAHAGCAQRKKPYSCIYTSNGVSLHEYAVSLLRRCKHSSRDNDDLCSTCCNGGDLLLCDLCPRSFHKECASLSSIPDGKWFCNYCEKMFEREKSVAHNANAVAAGRVSGGDPIEQISKRCIRIVKKSDDHGLTVCALCRCLDFSTSGFGPRTILICDQCEKEYHVSCLRDHQMGDHEYLPQGNWFCRIDCERIHSTLRNLIIQGNGQLSERLIDTIRKKHGENCPESEAEFNVSWRLFNGKVHSEEDRPLLSQIIAIFHNGFNPILYLNGEDLIPALVHGGKVDDVDYGGMYSAALIVDSVVVSAAVFRVFGPDVVELPLVATSEANRGKGFFQTLYSRLEGLFSMLKIKKIVLPSAEEAKGIWRKKFGFRRMTEEEIAECERTFQTLLRFQGTVMLHKKVPDLWQRHQLSTSQCKFLPQKRN